MVSDPFRPPLSVPRHDAPPIAVDLPAGGRATVPDHPALALLDGWQRSFPLVSRPFQVLAQQAGLSEHRVLNTLREARVDGVLSRIGPVLNPACFSSALVAMQVPAARLQSVARYISTLQAVNHNYEREHRFNLWFVAACSSDAALARLLDDIRQDTGCTPIALPMIRGYHIDLGFRLTPLAAEAHQIARPCLRPAIPLPAAGTPASRLLHAVQHGLELCAHPYHALAMQAGLPETDVLALLHHWIESDVFRRFGVVLHHRSLGFHANAMCVWDVPDDQVDTLGHALAARQGVSLCYQRRRHEPHWPYNLFCMIHGRERSDVLARRTAIASALGLDAWPHAVLFSTQCFKQRGARLGAAKLSPPNLHGMTITAREIPAGPRPRHTIAHDLDAVDRLLINHLQDGFPLSPRPFAAVADALGVPGLDENAVITRVQRLLADGVLSRFGPLFQIDQAGGAYCLAAMSVPDARWDEVLATVNAQQAVAHNYRRDHRFNMWFVLATDAPDKINDCIGAIEQGTGLPVLAFPKERSYFIGLKLAA